MELSSMSLSAGGELPAVAGAYYGAYSQKTPYNAAADTAETNARIAELRVQSQLKSSDREEQKHRLATANLKDTQRTALAANGVDLGEDNAARILAGTDVMDEIDALTIHKATIGAAGDTRMERVNYENDARKARNTARGVNPSSAAFTCLLGSATEIAGKWYSFDQAGAFGGSKTGAQSSGTRSSGASAGYQSPWSTPRNIGTVLPGITI